MTISIHGLPRAYVLLALYNNALYRGEAFKHTPSLNFIASRSGNGTQAKAEQLVHELQQTNQSLYFKEVDLGAGPRLLGVDLRSSEFNPQTYDDNHGAGLAEKVIDDVKKHMLSKTSLAEPGSFADALHPAIVHFKEKGKTRERENNRDESLNASKKKKSKPGTSETIFIGDLDKVDVLLALYNHAHSSGVTFDAHSVGPTLRYTAKQIPLGSRETTIREIKGRIKKADWFFDYVDLGAGSRQLRIRLSDNEFDSSAYN